MAPSNEVREAADETPDDLDAQIATLEADLAVPTERDVKARRLVELKAQRVGQEQAELRRQAERRVLGIRRAYTGLAEQLDQDGLKVGEAARDYAASVDRMNDRFLNLGKLRAEYEGLVEGFHLEAKSLPPVPILATRKEWLDASATVEQTGVPDTNRRRLEEVTGSEGYALLVRAGKIKA